MVKSSIFIIITAIMLVNNNHIYIYIYTPGQIWKHLRFFYIPRKVKYLGEKKL